MKSKKGAIEWDTIVVWVVGLIFFLLLILLAFGIKNKMMGSESSLLENIIGFFRRGLR